jgi:hypothetical protein
MTPEHSCRRAAELLSQALDEPLSTGERLQLRLHLFLCRSCRHVDDQFSELRGLSSQLFADDWGEADEDGAAPAPGQGKPTA